MSLGSTMETDFGTLKASISPASVDPRNASTRPRPSPWSRADWLDWRLVQNRELTVGWPCWETLKTFTQGAFGLTSFISHVHIGSGNAPWRFYHVKHSVFDVWCCFFLLEMFVCFSFKTCHLKVYHFPYMVENEGRNIFKQWDYYIWRKQEVVWFCTYSMCTVYHARHMKSAIMYIINMYFRCANKHIAFLHSTVMGQLLAHTGPDKDLRDSVVFGWLCFCSVFFL